MVALSRLVFLYLYFSSNPTRPPSDVPPALRARPHTGALSHKLLLLVLRRPRLKAAVHPPGEGAATALVPPKGGMPRSGRGDTDKRVVGGYRSKYKNNRTPCKTPHASIIS